MNRRSFLTQAVSAGAVAALGYDVIDSAVGGAYVAGRSPLALVYRGPASSPGIPADTTLFLRTCKQKFRIAYCGPRPGDIPINSTTLAAAALYVQPGGGDDFAAAWAAVRPHTGALRDFIVAGGRYLGVCMGGYLAGSNPGYALLPGDSSDYTQTRGAEVHDGRDAVITVMWPTGAEVGLRKIYYQDGPYFWVRKGTPRRVLARYTNGRIAAMIVPFGAGRVGVCGPHPEANRSWFQLAGLPYPGSTYDLGRQLVDALMAPS